MHAPFDQLAKNILYEFFVLFGTAQPAAEVPPTDAMEVDLWYVPDPARAPMRAQLTSGIMREIAVDPAMLEIFSQTFGDRAFHGCLRKRYQWQHVLEVREGQPWPLLGAWLTSPGPPDGVIEDYGFVPAKDGPTGHYVTLQAAWRIHILVLRELPRTRETVLLRLLAAKQVRRDAIADLLALPDDAWEKKVALPWLQRLNFEVPKEPATLSDEEKALMSEIQDWFEQYQGKVRDEGVKLGRAGTFARHFERRLGRALSDEERKALAERLDRLGEDRVDDALFGLASEALAAWLSDPAAS